MDKIIFNIVNSNLFHMKFDGLKWYENILYKLNPKTNEIKLYSCNYKKNYQCKKSHCKYLDGVERCTKTTQWKYAKRTPLNYIKRVINRRRSVK